MYGSGFGVEKRFHMSETPLYSGRAGAAASFAGGTPVPGGHVGLGFGVGVSGL